MDWPESGYDYCLSYDLNTHYWESYFQYTQATEEFKTFWINTHIGGSHDLNQQGVNISGNDSSNNIQWGTNAQDTMNGDGGNDIIFTYGGDDTIYGGSEDDIMDAGTGNDTIEGGSGKDTYIFHKNFGTDTITDDGLGDGSGNKDKIVIDANHITGEATLLTEVNGEKIYQININNQNYQLKLSSDNTLRIISGSSEASNSNMVIVNDFVDGDYGISLGYNISEEVKVNTYTQGNQANALIATLGNGNIVTIWQSADSGGHSGYFMQMFNQQGQKLGVETNIDNTIDFLLLRESIAVLNNGGFVVSGYKSASESPETDGIYLQIFDENGNQLGSDIWVNDETTFNNSDSSITSLASGNIVVSWTNEEGRDGNDFGIYAQMFSINGVKLGDEILVNTNTNNAQHQSSITSLSNGGFVISWENSLDNNIYMQRFDNGGNKIGGEALVNGVRSVENAFVASLNNGGYIAAWIGVLEANQGAQLIMNLYDSNGNLSRENVLIASGVPQNSTSPSITMLNNGNFVIASGISAQQFDLNGNKIGEKIIFEDTLGVSVFSTFPLITATNDGGFMISWNKYPVNDGGYGDVFISKFDSDGNNAGNFAYHSVSGSNILPLFSGVSSEITDQISLKDYVQYTGSNFDEAINSSFSPTKNNFINAGGGNNDVITFFGDDLILTGSGNDTIFSSQGNDIIFATDGDDIIDSGSGDDILNGDDGDDIIYGKAGNDIIIGGNGQDTLFGGTGDDIFRFSNYEDSKINASDLIKDFTSGEDKINLTELDLANHLITFDSNPNDGLSEGLSYHFDNDNNTVIEYHNDNQDHEFAIKLQGQVNLGNTDFEF